MKSTFSGAFRAFERIDASYCVEKQIIGPIFLLFNASKFGTAFKS